MHSYLFKQRPGDAGILTTRLFHLSCGCHSAHTMHTTKVANHTARNAVSRTVTISTSQTQRATTSIHKKATAVTTRIGTINLARTCFVRRSIFALKTFEKTMSDRVHRPRSSKQNEPRDSKLFIKVGMIVKSIETKVVLCSECSMYEATREGKRGSQSDRQISWFEQQRAARSVTIHEAWNDH